MQSQLAFCVCWCFLCKLFSLPDLLIEKLEIVSLQDCEGVLFDYVADNNAWWSHGYRKREYMLTHKSPTGNGQSCQGPMLQFRTTAREFWIMDVNGFFFVFISVERWWIAISDIQAWLIRIVIQVAKRNRIGSFSFLHNLQDNLNSCPNDNSPCSALSLYTDSVKEKKLTRKQSTVRACSAPPPRGSCCCSSSSHLGIGSSSNTTTAHARVEVPEALKRQEQ